MILRRLAQAFGQQKWSTVVTEIIIVVVGILIGLQVDDWNQRRIERAEVNAYLERLQGEVRFNVLAYREAIEVYDRASRLLTEYFNHLQDRAQPMPDVTELSAQLCRNGIMNSPRIDVSIYEEMVSTGYVRLMPNEALRDQLQETVGRQNAVIRAFEMQAPVALAAFARFEPYRNLQPLEDATTGNCSVDFAALEQNPRAASWVADIQRVHEYFAFVGSRVLEALEDTQQQFEDVLPSGD